MVAKHERLTSLMQSWPVRNTHGADRLWHAYLAYRVRNESDAAVGRYVEIRQIAESLCSQTSSRYEATIDALCWLALERGAGHLGQRSEWRRSDEGGPAPNKKEDIQPNPGLNLLTAAAYLGHLDLARRLLQEGHCPAQHNYLFSPPMEVAAFAGQADMLRLFQEHMPELEEPERPYSDNSAWQAKAGGGSLRGAALRGDLAMVRLACYPPSRSRPDGTNFAWRASRELGAAMMATQSWDVYQYIQAYSIKDHSHPTDHLIHHALYGNVEMVRHLLNAGAVVDGSDSRSNSNPLIHAARAGHQDVVELLLMRGADPNVSFRQFHGPAIYAAAEGGSLAILRTLLQNGAHFQDSDQWQRNNPVYRRTLGRAVALEHTAMVEFLLNKDVYNDQNSRSQHLRYVLNEAMEDGLESMVDLLQRHGAELGPRSQIVRSDEVFRAGRQL